MSNPGTRRVPVPGFNVTLAEWDDLLLLAAAVWGEARGESWQGRCAVAHVVLERAFRGGWFGTGGIRGVLLRDTTGDGVPDQFSCFRPVAMGGQLELLRDPLAHSVEDVWVSCYQIAVGCRFSWLKTTLPGATHYHTVDIDPGWAGMLIPLGTLGHHRFYRAAMKGETAPTAA